jgi:hypothetical protein
MTVEIPLSPSRILPFLRLNRRAGSAGNFRAGNLNTTTQVASYTSANRTITILCTMLYTLCWDWNLETICTNCTFCTISKSNLVRNLMYNLMLNLIYNLMINLESWWYKICSETLIIRSYETLLRVAGACFQWWWFHYLYLPLSNWKMRIT